MWRASLPWAGSGYATLDTRFPLWKTGRHARSIVWYAPCLTSNDIIQPMDGPMPLRNLFPESIFGRKLNPNAERRLRLSQARAEETIIRGHVDNALMFVDTLAEDLSFDRAIDTYIRVMAIPEPLASTVATRALVHLGRDLVPFRRRMQREGEDVAAEKPRLRLDEASRAQDIKRGA
ncbi:MAG: hypothetical protein NVSMB53_06510 [Gemmatimonadaceae bacterium]